MQTQVVFSEKCLEYGSRHIEGPRRVKVAADILRNKGYEFLEPEPACDEDVLLAHSSQYVSELRNGSIEDQDTPAYDNIYQYAKLSVGGAVLASQINGFSLMRPPGHHAGINGNALGAETRGFCYLNNIAIAVKKLSKKTLILDIDGHHGNGTQEIFQNDPKVTYVSLHDSPNYPGTGSSSEGNHFNYALPDNVGGRQYLETLEQALSKVDLGPVEIVAVSCGFDTHFEDLASLGLVWHDYLEIGKRIAKLKKPTFFVLEGGYVGEKLGEDIDSFLRGYEENR
jgi:acetoin utilization deacetylase AcuC-like enzyme